MAEFTASPTALTFVVDRSQPPQVLTQELTFSDADGTLALVDDVPWLSVPASFSDGVAFDVSLDTHKLAHDAPGWPRQLTETVRASGVLDDTDVVVTVKVKPGGPP